MAKRPSAGLLLFRRRGDLEIFLVHPGGPIWAKKGAGAWSLPKGEIHDGEEPLEAAKREFSEETGLSVTGEFRPLTPLKQPSGKTIHAWAVEADCDAAGICSNPFSMEWPPRSGQIREFPEIDRAEWFDIPEARRRIAQGQRGFIEQILNDLGTEEHE